MYEYLNYRNDPFEAERDFAREQAAEDRFLAETHADLVETGCTPEEMADGLCECGHPHSEHHRGHAYGLETFQCDECGCPEFSGVLPRIERKPVRLTYTAQGNLFDEEVA